MLFNTLQFGLFFLVVYSLYLLLTHRWQNRMLLVASYVFYGSWDAMFLTLILVSTILDYICGIQIEESSTQKRKKFFLFLSMAGNLSILGYFKYFNFFAASLQNFFGNFGFNADPVFMDIILPVGISFYTFQTMSYSIDIYRGLMKPTRNFLDFALYVAFFPQLVAGPIERASRLLPQILAPRTLTLDKFYAGCYLIFWGLFQKVFVADNLAKIADPIFAVSGPYEGSQVLIAVYAFTIQIFCDFAGYSNIARGLGKCMGFELMLNFNLPYFSTNPRELWQRWHISLSTWIRDYLFKSLGGYSKGAALASRNIVIAFFLGGLWHGANWTFVVWGVYHGILLMVYILISPFLKKIPSPKGIAAQHLWFLLRVIFFFHLFCLGALIFRSQTLSQAFAMLQSVFFNFKIVAGDFLYQIYTFLFYTWVLLGLQVVQFYKRDLDIVFKWPVPARTAFYFVCFYLFLIYGVKGGEQFYYFQF